MKSRLPKIRKNLPFVAVILLAPLTFFFPVNSTASQSSVVHLEGLSDQNTFIVKIEWIPADPGKVNTFNATFYDNDTGTLIEDVQYDFGIFGADGRSIVYRSNVHDPIQTAVFVEPGNYIIRISNIEGLGEGMSVPVRFSPEFSSDSGATTACALAGVLLAGIIFARQASNNVFRLAG